MLSCRRLYVGTMSIRHRGIRVVVGSDVVGAPRSMMMRTTRSPSRYQFRRPNYTTGEACAILLPKRERLSSVRAARSECGIWQRRDAIAYPPLSATHLPAMAQKMIGQHAGHHGLADRHRADADAGVVAALGHDVGVGALAIDRAARRQN
jgi:hypothetical protein